MNLDTQVLCTTFRLSSSQRTVSESEIAMHVRRSRAEVGDAFRRLGRATLVEARTAGTYRLTMSGLAVAAAVALALPGRGLRREAVSHAA